MTSLCSMKRGSNEIFSFPLACPIGEAYCAGSKSLTSTILCAPSLYAIILSPKDVLYSVTKCYRISVFRFRKIMFYEWQSDELNDHRRQSCGKGLTLHVKYGGIPQNRQLCVSTYSAYCSGSVGCRYTCDTCINARFCCRGFSACRQVETVSTRSNAALEWRASPSQSEVRWTNHNRRAGARSLSLYSPLYPYINVKLKYHSWSAIAYILQQYFKRARASR